MNNLPVALPAIAGAKLIHSFTVKVHNHKFLNENDAKKG